MIAQKSHVMDKMVTRLEELSSDEEKRRFIDSIKMREMDDKYKLEAAVEEERKKWEGTVARLTAKVEQMQAQINEFLAGKNNLNP